MIQWGNFIATAMGGLDNGWMLIILFWVLGVTALLHSSQRLLSDVSIASGEKLSALMQRKKKVSDEMYYGTQAQRTGIRRQV